MAPTVSTFFSGVSWAGKTVVPFMTNGGWPGHVIADMRKAATGAKCGPTLEVQFDSAGGATQETPQRKVNAWIDQVKQLL